MKKILLISASPVANGYGDAILQEAGSSAKTAGAKIKTIHLRNIPLNPCLACQGCSSDGICVQNDDMKMLIDEMHGADAILFSVPVYYNYMAAQAVIFLDRLYCTYNYKNYVLGNKKKVAVFLTCEGSEKAFLKKQINEIMALGSIKRSVAEYRTEVFRGCEDKLIDFYKTVREIGTWAAN